MDWQTGKYVVEPDKDMKKYLEVYHDQFHLGKPRVSERLSANAYWVSLFSKLWKAYWKLNINEELLKKLVNMVSVANYLFIYLIDVEIKKFIEKNINSRPMTYPAWVAYRKVHKDKYKKYVLDSLRQ